MRILVVEDETLLAESIVEVLRGEAYAVDLAPDGDTASELAAVNTYDLIVLDWMIPPPTGLELLREWRGAEIETPVLMLTGRSGVEDRVGGLDSGADDYLTKPFSMVELLARVRSLLRRRARPLDMELRAGDVLLDRASRKVTVDGKPVELSPKEFALLEYLLSRVGEVVTRTEISEHVWDDDFDSMSNVIDVTVHRLRRKIDGDRERTLIHGVRGVGYVLGAERERPD